MITQSAMAFSQLLGAFSLVVTQIQSLSSYAAVLARLTGLVTGVDNATLPAATAPGSLEVEGRLAYEDLTLRSRRDGSVLVERLSVEVSRGTRVLVTGPEDAQLALFRATAGLWDTGDGRIVRPPADRIMFLPERPYLPPGTLREALLRTKHEGDVADPTIVAVLGELGLEPLLARVGGLDAERDWDDALSLSEQQLVAVARVVLAAPSFAVLQSSGSTLGAEALERVVVRLSGASVGCLVFGAPVRRERRLGRRARPPPRRRLGLAAGAEAGSGMSPRSCPLGNRCPSDEARRHSVGLARWRTPSRRSRAASSMARHVHHWVARQRGAIE